MGLIGERREGKHRVEIETHAWGNDGVMGAVGGGLELE